MGKFFLKFFFTPVVCVQNDQRHGDHFEVCMLGYPLTPPLGVPTDPTLGPLTADPPTHLKPPPPPTSRPPKVFAPVWGLEFEQAAPLGWFQPLSVALQLLSWV